MSAAPTAGPLPAPVAGDGADVARLARADLLLAAAGALAPPESGALERTAALADEGAALAAAAGADPALGVALEALAEAARATPPDAAAGEYRRLFDTATACPIHEAGWVRRDKGAILGDVAAFQRAFGVAPRPDSGERPDHIVAELELAAVLLVLRARADLEGRGEDAATCARALRSFAGEHLGDWLPAFAARLAEATALVYYERLAEALERAWASVAAAEGLAPPPERLPMAEVEEGTPYECGMSQEEER
jgi:TorA-specific chaperone